MGRSHRRLSCHLATHEQRWTRAMMRERLASSRLAKIPLQRSAAFGALSRVNAKPLAAHTEFT